MGKSTVVIVEDESVLLDILHQKLESVGFRVIDAVNGVQGLEKIKKHQPRLVLLDFAMPEMDGFEVLRSMQKNPKLKDIPVIIISNSGEGIEVKEALQLGACDYLVKADFTPNEVLEKVERCLSSLGAPKASLRFIQKALLEDEEPEEKTKPARKQRKSKKHTIMIIEDDPFLVEIASKKLIDEGFGVIVADNGLDGVEEFLKQKPDLLLLDVRLPDIDGFEVMKKIQESRLADIKKIPVIFLSNFGQEENRDRALALGAKDYLVKANYTTREIVKRISQELD